MGQPYNRPDFSLDQFHVLFQNTHWEVVPPDEDSSIPSEDLLPEACYRSNTFLQTIEIGYHEPIDQIALTVRYVDKEPSLKLFFFLGNQGGQLVKTLISFIAMQQVELNSLNTMLIHTAAYCQFTLLELPGEGLFEVGPQKAKA